MAHRKSADALRRLAAIDRLFDDAGWLSGAAVHRAREGARDRASLRMGDRAVDGTAGLDVPRAFASDMISALAVELVTRPAAAAPLVEHVAEELQLAAAVLGRDVLRSPDLLPLPPRVAIEVQVGLLALFAPLVGVALWTLEATGGLHCLHRVGSDTTQPDLQAVAQSLLTREGVGKTPPAPVVGVAVERWQQPVAALVGRAAAGGEGCAQAMLIDALPVLCAAIERDGLLNRNAGTERALIESGDRRLTRLGLDIHDGPLQDLTLLAEDLRMFRQQLADRLSRDPRNERLLGRVDDLEAQLGALDADLRRVATSLQSPFLLDQSFPVALQHILDGFEARVGIRPRLSISDDLSWVTSSQQMALLAVVRESLNNVREHSGASSVAIDVSSLDNGTRVRIEDDGRGFDVEPTLVRSARDGHLGLVGMHERVRLLGGHSEIVSRPGGPTVVSVTLPRWQPVDSERGAGAGTPTAGAERDASVRRS